MPSKSGNIALFVACSLGLAACATSSGNGAGLTGALPEGAAATASPEFLIRSAQLLIKEQQFGRAGDSFEKILTILPKNEEAQAGLAVAARLAGEPGMALGHYRQLEEYPARRNEALEGQGLALIQLQRWSEAEAVLLAALEADKGLWRSWNAVGQLRDHQGRWSDAESAYVKAISLQPSRSLLYNNLGVSYLCQARYDEAVEQFDLSLALKHQVVTVEGNRLVALAMKGSFDTARKSISVSNSHYALNNLGYVALMKGDRSRAVRFLGMAMEESPRFYQKASENLKMLNANSTSFIQ